MNFRAAAGRGVEHEVSAVKMPEPARTPRSMKGSIAFAAMFVLGAAALFAQADSSRTRFSIPLLDDAVRMTKAGLSDATIVAYVKARRARLPSILSAGELIQLRRAGVSETVVRYLASVTAVDVGQTGEGRREEVTEDSTEGRAYPVEPASGGGYPYPYGYGFYPPYGGGYFSSPVFFLGHPFFHHPFFFRHPFFHRRFFFRGRFFHRPFFPGRGFRGGFVGPRGSFPVGSAGPRNSFPPMRGRIGRGFRGPR